MVHEVDESSPEACNGELNLVDEVQKAVARTANRAKSVVEEKIIDLRGIIAIEKGTKTQVVVGFHSSHLSVFCQFVSELARL